MEALGLIETRGLVAAVECADAMLKAADVTLLEKTYVGGGLVSIAVTGGVSSVKAAVEAGAAAVGQLSGELLNSQHVIARPHEDLDGLIGFAKPIATTETAEIKPMIAEPVTTVVLDIEVMADKAEDNAKEEHESKNEGSEAEGVIESSNAEEKKTFPFQVDVENLNKKMIDYMVLEYGLDEAISFLGTLKVTKLRQLIREFKNIGVAGRMISKATKKTLLEGFETYYRK